MIHWLNRTHAPSERKNTLPIGMWMPIIIDRKLSAYAACPRCSVVQSLEEHDIDASGVVTPSAQCDCGFHEMIGLREWDPAFKPYRDPNP